MLFLITLSIILGIDSFVTCFSVGVCNSTINKKKALVLFLSIGLFHFLMPLIGFLPSTICKSISSHNLNYVSAFVFAFLSLKMIFDGVKSMRTNRDCNCDDNIINLSFFKIVLISFLVSIDSLVAGFSLSISSLSISLFTVATLFSLSSLLLSMIGFYFGKLLNIYFKDYANIIGGLTLLILAIKFVLL